MSGTATVMFTDLVGSTELLVRLGEDRFRTVAESHESLLASSVTSHGGTLVKNTGDGVMAIFHAAADAVASATEIQKRIEQHYSKSDPVLSVRIGISAGDTVERDGDYHGLAVVEGARLCAAATGFQILVSRVAHHLAGSFGGHTYVDVGELELKGLPPVPAVAVRWSPSAPVRTAAHASTGNLSAPLDRFVGRQPQRARIRELLQEGRLVTILGAGGSGKTRLAVEVARDCGPNFRGGTWFVDLSRIEGEGLVAESVAATLGLGRSNDATQAVHQFIARQPTLLLIDNCEHLIEDAATFVAECLRASPDLRVLATSREPLRIPGEHEFRLNPLIPDEAADLFVQRASAVSHLDEYSTEAIRRICTKLDGIPLAIELAAARVRVLSCQQIADRLDDQLALLAQSGRARPDRHQTMRLAIEWSYGLLDDPGRVALRRASIFSGGFTLDAAEEVIGDDALDRSRVLEALEQLVSRSLVLEMDQENEPRFRLLEPIRQYALEQLRLLGDDAATSDRHRTWTARLCRAIARDFYRDTRVASARARTEHGNITQALESALAAGQSVLAGSMIESLGEVWFTAGQPDALYWCERVLGTDGGSPRSRAGVLLVAGMLHQNSVTYADAVPLLLQARDLYQEAGSRLREAWTLTWLGRAAWAVNVADRPPRAWFQDALDLYREVGHASGVGWCSALLAGEALAHDDLDQARALAEEAVRIGRAESVVQTLGEGLRLLMVLDAMAGDVASADDRAESLIEVQRASGDRWQLAAACAAVSEVASLRGQLQKAARFALATTDLAVELHSRERMFEAIGAAAMLAKAAGFAEEAGLLLGCWQEAGARHSVRADRYLAVLQQPELASSIAQGRGISLDDAIDHAQALARRVLAASS